MEEEKRKKKNKKKKNKSNTNTNSGTSASVEEIQISNNKNKADLESKGDSQVNFTSVDQEIRDFEKKKYGAEAVAEKVSDWKDAVERHESEVTLLRDKLAQCDVIQACKDEEIERLKAEKELLLQKKASTDNEVKKLQVENFRLQKEVEQLKESLETISQDHRQLSTKLVDVQTGLQQLETEARVRAQVEHANSVDTTGLSKVNQVHTTVDQLNRKFYNVTEPRNGRHSNTEENATTLSLSEIEEKSTNTKLSDGVTESYQPFISVTNNDGTESDQPFIRVTDNDVTESGQLFISATSNDGTETDQPSIRTNNDGNFFIESETETTTVSKEVAMTDNIQNCLAVPDSAAAIEEAKQRTSDLVREPADTIIHNKFEEAVPFSDAPLMGAPLRLFSFITKYVSGADLVKPKNLVSH